MTIRYLVVADPVAALNPEFDLGVCLSQELLGRGIEVDYLDLLATDPDMPADDYLSALPVQRILSADRGRHPFWDLGPTRLAAVTEYQVILQRKDPPVDARFIAYCRLFEKTPPHVLQVNRPPATYEFSEHTLQLRYPEHAAPTWVCESWEELLQAVREQRGEAVCKPLNAYCGIGVTFFARDAREEHLREFWERWKPRAIVQPLLKDIEETGDLRILTIGRHVLGSVLRVPLPGTRIANLHRGATAAPLEPTKRQLEACRAAAEDLNPKGLYLLGLDFIGEHLTEINITSPTLVVQINQVMGKRADVELVDEIERIRSEMARR